MRDVRVSFPRPCDAEWDGMGAAGPDRFCARCDRVVHDLSDRSVDEVEAMLRRDPQACVRARIGADGALALKPGRRGGARRMVAAAAATAGLMTTGAPALAKPDGPTGAIAGKVRSSGFQVRITATAADGRTFRAKSLNNGRFRIKRLPAGTYRLTFAPFCGEAWTVDDVVVGQSETVVKDDREYIDTCIIIGRLRIEEHRG